VAVWVGFLALFGIASDDGVLNALTLTSDSMEKSLLRLKKSGR
jgi:energy-converting hydrogenase Eha subunit G